MITKKKPGITNTAAAAAIIIILVVATGAAYFYLTSTGGTTTTTTTTPTGGGSTTTTTTTTTTNAKPNPTILTEDTIGQPQNLDPAIDYETAGGSIIQNVYENLMFYQGYNSAQVVPWLASSMTVSPNGTVYTFALRHGIKFSDGTPFNSTAVKFSILREVLIDDPSSPAWTVTQSLWGAQNYSSQYNCASDCYTQANVNKFLAGNPILTPDPYTVVVRLEKAYAPWAFVMAFSATSVVDPSAIISHWTAPTNASIGYITGITAGDYQDAANPWAITKLTGTGPNLLWWWDLATHILILMANPNYWG